MVLVYLTLDADQFTEFDAHYFPETAIHITRLSEPKNYSLTTRAGTDRVCARTAVRADRRGMVDERRAARRACRARSRARRSRSRAAACCRSRLGGCRTRIRSTPRAIARRSTRWIAGLAGIDGLVTFGRQGLFAHDNTHHTMAMAYALVECSAPTARSIARPGRGLAGHSRTMSSKTDNEDAPASHSAS